jgi:glycosyltransferase involved in cell wall biosynthesis
MNPLISIVIPVYNAAAEIRQCLVSIFRSSWPYFEVIVVDDGSTDNSMEIANEYQCLVLGTGSNQGPAHARNLGVDRARADIILFLDADTELPANALGLFYEAFQTNPAIVAVIALPNDRSLRRSRASDYNALRNHFSLLSAASLTDYFTTQMGAMRKQTFLAAGGFSEKYRHADIEDYELGLRLQPGTILIHKGIIIGHHFPSFRVILDKYMRRAALLASLTRERRRLAKAHSNLSRVVSVGLASLSFLLLPLMLVSRYFGLAAVIAVLLLTAVNGGLFRFAARTRGLAYLPEALFWEYVFSLAIFAGGLLCRPGKR